MHNKTLSDILRDMKVAPALIDRLPRTVLNLGGGRVPFTFVIGNIAGLNTAAETIIATTPPLNPGADAANVLLLGCYSVSTGATTTALVTRIRQTAALTGTVVNSSQTQSVTAGNVAQSTAIAIDTPGAVAGMQYVLTGQATGASAGTGGINSVFIALALG